MRILALDTTAQFGSIALLDCGVLIEEALLHSPEGFAQTLYSSVRGALERNGLSLDQIDCFAAAAGPGSFTGVRVGLAAIKGLAEAQGKPAFGVSNLQALAEMGTAGRRAAIIDARRGEIYGGVYDAALRIVKAETVTKFQHWLGELPEGDLEFVSTDFGPFRAAIAGTRFRDTPVRECRAIAAAVGRIAAQRVDAGEKGDPAGIDANYVRRSDAELLWTDRR